MTTESRPRIKITYATLRNDNEELHAAYEAGVEAARARLGASHPNVVDGRERGGDGEFELRSPIDTDILVGSFAQGGRARTSRTRSRRLGGPSRRGRRPPGRSAWRSSTGPPTCCPSAR